MAGHILNEDQLQDMRANLVTQAECGVDCCQDLARQLLMTPDEVKDLNWIRAERENRRAECASGCPWPTIVDKVRTHLVASRNVSPVP